MAYLFGEQMVRRAVPYELHNGERIMRKSIIVLVVCSVLLNAFCSREKNSSMFSMPQKIIDLNPTITPDLPSITWGAPLLNAIGFDERTKFVHHVYDEGIYYS